MSKKNTTKVDREAKLAELHERIGDGVAALVESETWQVMLTTAARFHRYSLSNVLLIGMQAPQATRVAGFRTWKSVGRQVRKGERGIAILAPCTYRPKAASAKDDSSAASPTGEAATPAESSKPGASARRQVRGFRVVHVFDVSQTDGEPLADVRPALLAGQAPAGLWDALAAQVAGHGYTLERGDCGRANGYTDPATRTVRVRADVDDAQAVKTLIHELGHIECGHVTDLPTYRTCRERCEVEAESVAYVVAAAQGMDTSGYSFAYVAGFAGGEPATVRQCAEAVIKAAHAILDRLDPASSDQSDESSPSSTDPAEPVAA